MLRWRWSFHADRRHRGTIFLKTLVAEYQPWYGISIPNTRGVLNSATARRQRNRGQSFKHEGVKQKQTGEKSFQPGTAEPMVFICHRHHIPVRYPSHGKKLFSQPDGIWSRYDSLHHRHSERAIPSQTLSETAGPVPVNLRRFFESEIL